MTGSEGHNESHEQLERQNSLADTGTATKGSNPPQILGGSRRTILPNRADLAVFTHVYPKIFAQKNEVRLHNTRIKF